MGEPKMTQNSDMMNLNKIEKSHLVEHNELISNFEKDIKFNFTGASEKASESQ